MEQKAETKQIYQAKIDIPETLGKILGHREEPLTYTAIWESYLSVRDYLLRDETVLIVNDTRRTDGETTRQEITAIVERTWITASIRANNLPFNSGYDVLKGLTLEDTARGLPAAHILLRSEYHPVDTLKQRLINRL